MQRGTATVVTLKRNRKVDLAAGLVDFLLNSAVDANGDVMANGNFTGNDSLSP